MKSSVFKFKEFDVRHGASAMKVGVDAVLLGTFAETTCTDAHVFDAGCGCGIVSMICAQRFPDATVEGMDIHLPSLCDALPNAVGANWYGRIRFLFGDCSEYFPKEKYDLVVSNPPFFDSGVVCHTSREYARHCNDLSPENLVRIAPRLLKHEGSLAIIYPSDRHIGILKEARKNGLYPYRILHVRGREGKTEKRVVTQFSFCDNRGCVESFLSIFDLNGCHTADYINLTKDFYLNF